MGELSHQEMGVGQFASIYLNRDLFNMMQDSISDQLPIGDTVTYSELQEMQRIWLVQLIHGETYKNILGDSNYYGVGSSITMTLERYKLLFKCASTAYGRFQCPSTITRIISSRFVHDAYDERPCIIVGCLWPNSWYKHALHNENTFYQPNFSQKSILTAGKPRHTC